MQIFVNLFIDHNKKKYFSLNIKNKKKVKTYSTAQIQQGIFNCSPALSRRRQGDNARCDAQALRRFTCCSAHLALYKK